jgi:hypothetical protein
MQARNLAFAKAVQAFAAPYQKALDQHLTGNATYARYKRDVQRLKADSARLLKAAGDDPKKRQRATGTIAANVTAAQRRCAPLMQKGFERAIDGVKYWGELMMLIQKHGGGSLKAGTAGSAHE